MGLMDMFLLTTYVDHIAKTLWDGVVKNEIC